MQKLTIFGAMLFLLWACKKENDLPADPFGQVSAYLRLSPQATDYSFTLPGHFNKYQPVIPFQNDKIELGRVIFYDRSLSSDGTVSCASCHHQQFAFGDSLALSAGVMGNHTTRNSMALTNTMSFGGFIGIVDSGTTRLPLFWDSRALSIQAQSRAAFTNPVEMAIPMSQVVSTVAAQPYYPWLFNRAYGDSSITEGRILESIAHFLNSLHTHQSRYDMAMSQHISQGGTLDIEADFSGLTTMENRGKTLYIDHCNSCHAGLDNSRGIFEANNGLESPYIDKGKFLTSGKFFDIGIFRVPMLRNIAHSGPYMHDGRFKTLDEVIEHYNSGVRQVFGLHGDLLEFDEASQTYSAQRLHLSTEDKAALKAFLETLSDEKTLSDPRFGNPFFK